MPKKVINLSMWNGCDADVLRLVREMAPFPIPDQFPELNLAKCRNITPRGVILVSQLLMHSDVVVCKLFKCSLSLTLISLAGCRRVTNAGIGGICTRDRSDSGLVVQHSQLTHYTA